MLNNLKYILYGILIFFATRCFAAGLDEDTKLLLSGDLAASSESTTDGSLEIMDATGTHIVTQADHAAITQCIAHHQHTDDEGRA